MVNKDEVKNAIEYIWRGRQVKIYLCLWAGILALAFFATLVPLAASFANGNGADGEALGIAMAVMGVVYTLCIGPFILHSAFCQWEMLRNCGRYERHWVKLDEPNTSWNYRQSVGYRVVFQSKEMGKIARYTKPIFSSSAFGAFALSEYNNKTVEIFYDPAQDRVILVGNPK